MNEKLINDAYDASFDEIKNEALTYEGSMIQRIVLKEIDDRETELRRIFDENEGLERITEISRAHSIRSLSEQGRCFEDCFGVNLVEVFKDMSNDPYAYCSSDDLSRDDARPALSACDFMNADICYKVIRKTKLKKSDKSSEDGECCERKPLTRGDIKREIARVTLFPQTKPECVRDKKFPVFHLVSVILCVAIMIIPIYLSVLNNDVNVANKEYDAYIRELEEEIEILNEELCRKNDIAVINRIAREEYGMIDVELSNTHLMSPSSDKIVLAQDDEVEENGILISLLNALGIFKEK